MCVPQTDSLCTEGSWGCGPGIAPDIWGRRCDRREWPLAHKTIWRRKDKERTNFYKLHKAVFRYIEIQVIHLWFKVNTFDPSCYQHRRILCMHAVSVCVLEYVQSVTSCRVNTPCLRCPTAQQETSSRHVLRPPESCSPHLYRTSHHQYTVHISMRVQVTYYLQRRKGGLFSKLCNPLKKIKK